MVLPKISGYGYFLTFKLKNGDKDKDNKLMSLCIDDDNLLKKYKTIWTKAEGLQNIKLNALPVEDDILKTK